MRELSVSYKSRINLTLTTNQCLAYICEVKVIDIFLWSLKNIPPILFLTTGSGKEVGRERDEHFFLE